MGKKCPPGVICIENMTLLLISIVVGYMIYKNIGDSNNRAPIESTTINSIHSIRSTLPPLVHNESSNIAIPITVNTQRMEVGYRQVGILTRINSNEVILPLYGRMVNTSRVKWQYHTMNDSNNHVRLPINVNGRSGSDECGVDEVYSGDTIYVQGYDDIFKVTIYENNRFTYNSF